MTDVGLEHLKSLKNLTDLQLSVRKVTAGGIEELKKRCRNARLLRMQTESCQSDKSPSNKVRQGEGRRQQCASPPAIAPLDAAQAK